MFYGINLAGETQNINLIKAGAGLPAIACFNVIKPLRTPKVLEGLYFSNNAPVRPGVLSFLNWTHSTTSSLLNKEIKGE